MFLDYDGSDEKVRLAAKIGAEHFDELLHMPEVRGHKSGQNILTSDLDLDIKMLDGNVSGVIDEAVSSNSTKAALLASAAALSGLATGALMEFPPVFLVAGSATAGLVVAARRVGSRSERDASEIRSKSLEDQKIFGSWPEVNGGKHS